MKIKAFTLIEVLVVMFIISITMSVVAINFRGGIGYHQKVEDMAGHLLMQMIWIQEKAVLEGKTIGIHIQPQQYQFLYYGFDTALQQWRWKPLEKERLLKNVQMPDDIHLAVDIKNSHDKKTRLVVFYASGEVTPFEVTLHSKEKSIQYRLQGQANGDIQLLEGGNP